MPGKARPTGNSNRDCGYNNSSSGTKPSTQSPSSSSQRKRFLLLSRFSWCKYLTSFSFLLFQSMTRAVLFYNEGGKFFSIPLQGDLYISYYWGARPILKDTWHIICVNVIQIRASRVHILCCHVSQHHYSRVRQLQFPSTEPFSNSSLYCIRHATQK